MLPRNHPDRIQIAFDDHRLVANAGLILPATLALRLGLPQLLRKHLDLGCAGREAAEGAELMLKNRLLAGSPKTVDPKRSPSSVIQGSGTITLFPMSLTGIPEEKVAYSRGYHPLCASAEPGANSRCGPTAASIPTPSRRRLLPYSARTDPHSHPASYLKLSAPNILALADVFHG